MPGRDGRCRHRRLRSRGVGLWVQSISRFWTWGNPLVHKGRPLRELQPCCSCSNPAVGPALARTFRARSPLHFCKNGLKKGLPSTSVLSPGSVLPNIRHDELQASYVWSSALTSRPCEQFNEFILSHLCAYKGTTE